MDLKVLREQAINEANDSFSEESINNFKSTIKNIVYKISENNSTILKIQKQNEGLKKQLTEYELKEFNRVII